jgi:hypothetical protein
MSINTEIMLVMIILVLEILGIIIYAIVTSDWFAKKFADKIENATVHVWNGKGYEPVKGKLINIVSGEYIYQYRWFKAYQEVHCPASYKIQYEKRRRIIFAQAGRYLPIPIFPQDESIKNYSEAMLSQGQLVYSCVELVKTLKKSGIQITATMLLIIGLVILAAGGGIWYFNSKNHKTTPTNGITTTIPHVITTGTK